MYFAWFTVWKPIFITGSCLYSFSRWEFYPKIIYNLLLKYLHENAIFENLQELIGHHFRLLSRFYEYLYCFCQMWTRRGISLKLSALHSNDWLRWAHVLISRLLLVIRTMCFTTTIYQAVCTFLCFSDIMKWWKFYEFSFSFHHTSLHNPLGIESKLSSSKSYSDKSIY